MGSQLAEICNLRTGLILERRNRFLLSVQLEGEEVLAHLKETARLRSYIYRGNEVLLREAPRKLRKTRWDVWFAKLRDKWILLNSHFHPKLVRTAIELGAILRGCVEIKEEVKISGYSSRFDLSCYEGNKLRVIEVKGVTLYDGEYGLFPDALSLRARRHVKELTELQRVGTATALVFLAPTTDISGVKVNYEEDPELSHILRAYLESGGEIIGVKLRIEVRGVDRLTAAIYFESTVPFLLS